ncbi:MAG: hypothetical protein QOH21_3570 [Acidobacteriota bacterium]|jgi:hypothetical protein|nr:hypothetical protein [Acidobacteriota bacterium]
MAYSYDGGPIWAERVARGTDHCGSVGPVYELSTLVIGGTIHDPEDRSYPFSTRRADTRARRLIYAVDGKYQINVGVDGKRGSGDAVKHETLFHNADVVAAGEMDIENGVIVAINDHSGSYLTYGSLDLDPAFADAVLIAIDRANAPLDSRERLRLGKKAQRS